MIFGLGLTFAVTCARLMSKKQIATRDVTAQKPTIPTQKRCDVPLARYMPMPTPLLLVRVRDFGSS